MKSFLCAVLLISVGVLAEEVKNAEKQPGTKKDKRHVVYYDDIASSFQPQYYSSFGSVFTQPEHHVSSVSLGETEYTHPTSYVKSGHFYYPYALQVEKHVPVPYAVRVPVEVPKPYPVHITKHVQVPVHTPYIVKVPQPYAVHVPYPVHVPTKIEINQPPVVVETKTAAPPTIILEHKVVTEAPYQHAAVEVSTIPPPADNAIVDNKEETENSIQIGGSAGLSSNSQSSFQTSHSFGTGHLKTESALSREYLPSLH